MKLLGFVMSNLYSMLPIYVYVFATFDGLSVCRKKGSHGRNNSLRNVFIQML